MAADDDINELLRQVEAQTSRTGPALPAGARSGGAQAAPVEPDRAPGRSARTTWAILAAAGSGAAGWAAAGALSILPLVDFSMVSAGLGAAIGGAVTAVVSGPPRWFGR